LSTLNFSKREIEKIINSKNNLGNNAFLYEKLLDEGFEVYSFLDENYPRLLKENLESKQLPPVIYLKGNSKILNEESIAIVGSRNASEISLSFVDNITKKAVSESKVVVSGFAKCVDKRALDTTLSLSGKSIIVLPQGILTFNKGFLDYHKHIVSGKLLVLSTFYPNAKWNEKLAMIRNAYIYGLAEEIYVAESDVKGGTYNGAIAWLKTKRNVYIRKPKETEKNANNLLIEKGGIPVDDFGNELNHKDTKILTKDELIPIQF